MWEQWLQKGAEIFDGTYELSDDGLRLKGRFVNSSEDSLLVMRRLE